jgi:hypothetical protein
MYNHILYLSYWLINTLLVYILYSIFPDNIVLGTWKFNSLEAAIYSSFWVTFVVWTAWDFIYSRQSKFMLEGGLITNLYFWAINTMGVWIVARFPGFTGIGISSFVWAFVIGGIFNIFQRIVLGLILGRKWATAE